MEKEAYYSISANIEQQPNGRVVITGFSVIQYHKRIFGTKPEVKGVFKTAPEAVAFINKQIGY